MAQSKSAMDKATSKWDSIQKTNSQTIDKLLKGNASSGDIKALGAILAKYEALAHQVFAEGIMGVESTTDSIVEKLNRERIAEGKKALTVKAQERLYQSAFKEVLRDAAPDIIGQVYDVINEKEGSPDASDDPNLDIYLSRLLSTYASKVPGSGVHTMDGDGEDDRSRRPSDVANNIVGNNTTGTTISSSQPVVLLNPSVETDVVDTLQSQKTFHDGVLNALNVLPEREEELEEKKNKGWWRSFKSWFKEKKPKTTGGWLSAILKGLLVAVTAPGLIVGIAAKIKELLGFDTITSWVSDKWKELKSSANSLIDDILISLGLKKSPEEIERDMQAKKAEAPMVLSKVNKQIADQESRIKNTQKMIDDDKAKGRQPNRKQEAFVANATRELEKAYATKKDYEQALTYQPKSDVTNVSSTVNPSATVNNNGDVNVSSTNVRSANVPAYDPKGVTKEVVPPDQKVPGVNTGSKTVSGNIIGLDSFNMSPRLDDSLFVLNLGGIA